MKPSPRLAGPARRTSCPAACLLLIAAALLPPPALAESAAPPEGLDFFDTGPLRIRDQFLLGMGFLAFDPAGADVLGRGGWQVDFAFSMTNTWTQSDAVRSFLMERERRQPLGVEELRAIDSGRADRGIFLADGELYRGSFSVRRGLGRGLQLVATVPVLSFQGGFGDSIIEGFHDLVGLGQAGRLGLPRNRYHVYLRDARGNEVYRSEIPGVRIGDIKLGVKGRIPAPPERWKIAFEALVKLPTGDADLLYGSGSADFGVQLLATRYYTRSCIHASFGVAYLGRHRTFQTSSQSLLSGMVGYEHALASRTSAIVQLTASQSPFRFLEVDRIGELAYLITAGIKRGLSEKLVTFVALTENLATEGSALDVGLHFGVTRTF